MPVGIIDVPMIGRDHREHLPNLQLGKLRPREHRWLLFPQPPRLGLGLRPRTADVQVLAGFWGFRMTQGTQLPKEMRSF